MLRMRTKTRIFTAKKILTMYPEHPIARAVAVKDGRILGVGNVDDLIHWLKLSAFAAYTVDPTFEDKILIPGLVDPHTHLELQALIYSGHFVAQIPWPKPEGGFHPVYPNKDAVMRRLKELDAVLPPGDLIYAVAYDENKTGAYLHIDDLDKVSTTRPILVSNLVFHRFWANSFLLKKAGVPLTDPPRGVDTGPDGKPNGTLIEADGLMQVVSAIPDLIDLTEEKLRYILPLFYAGGNTTIAEAAFGASGMHKSVAIFRKLFASRHVHLRVIGMPWAKSGIAEAGSLTHFIGLLKGMKKEALDTLRIGPVKLYTDGSIISKTSPIGWPGYWDGSAEGVMQGDPDEIKKTIIRLHAEGLQTVSHANSRPGCQIVLDAVREAQSRCYRPDMRHRIDHAYNINEAQLRQAKALGVNVQFFSTQIYYYGDEHLKLQGPDRAHQITPIGTAQRLGVSWGFHNDPPGTPQLPWVGAWAAVHRMTQKSKTVLGPAQRITVQDALRAMTIEAAYQLHLDAEVGSIEFGKKADFCVLEADPLEIDPLELKDIPVWGTVFGGELNPARRHP